MIAVGVQPSRLVAAFANISVWLFVMAVGSMLVSRRVELTQAARSLVYLGIMQGALVLVSQIVFPRLLPVPVSLIPKGILPSGVAAFAENKLYYSDWLGEVAFRSAGIMGNPTWAGAFGACVFLLCVFSKSENLRISLSTRIAGGAAGVYIVDVSLSRSTNLALTAALILGGLTLVKRHYPTVAQLGIAGLIGSSAVVLAFLSSQLTSELASLNDERADSLVTRSQIYEATLFAMRDLVLPALGFGIKPQVEGLGASLGTHSTYLGLLFRGGFIAAIAFIVFILRLVRKSWLAGSPFAMSVGVFVTLWAVFEDFDGGHMVPVFVGLALVLARPKQEFHEKQ